MNKLFKTCALIGIAMISIMHASFAQAQQFEEDFDDENKPWEEIAIQLPPAPQADNLLSFYVSPTATQTFAVDGKSISVGSDGVVRYTLIAISHSGAKSVSYEGIRCATFEKKIYAIGRDDGTWSRSRRDKWEGIVRGNANRQHAALAMDYFCSNLIVASDAKEMLRRLKSHTTLTGDLLNR
jgi:hypothetical protein